MSFQEDLLTVIMPTYKMSHFIHGAIKSLQNQSYKNWELLVIDDGSPDQTSALIKSYQSDNRIKYFRNESNVGLGAALNQGLNMAASDLIAYLPSDDIIYQDHLSSLYTALVADTKAIASCSGIIYNSVCTASENSYESTLQSVPGFGYQLVQILHRKVDLRWLERSGGVTDALGLMFWEDLIKLGKINYTNHITAEWVNHPDQRSKIILENFGGGIHKYKKYYGVSMPIVFSSSYGNCIDEVSYFKPFRKVPKVNQSEPLKILLLGELAYNPERIYAIEQSGHKLYALWSANGQFFNTVGPLPFGNVTELSLDNWAAEIEALQPDVIYALLNYNVIALASAVKQRFSDVPFIWHFKEGPFLSRQLGSWKQLVDLYNTSDGVIYTNSLVKSWMQNYIEAKHDQLTIILDGDLPKKHWFDIQRSELISKKSGEIHTIIPGRPFGLTVDFVSQLASAGIHFHFYGNVNHSFWERWIYEINGQAPGYIHLHPQCTQNKWVKEFSKYDAGWLHMFYSNNGGDLRKATWDDLNLPARMSTLIFSGVPLIQVDNSDHLVASQQVSREYGMGIFFKDGRDLASQLTDESTVNQARDNVWRYRKLFTFDYHVPMLIKFFHRVIKKKRGL